MNGLNWLLMGQGKTAAARAAPPYPAGDVLAKGSVGLDVRDHTLYGRYDPGRIIAGPMDTTDIHAWHRIDMLAYGLDEALTRKVFGFGERALRQVPFRTIAGLSVRDRYAGTLLKSHLSEYDYARAALAYDRVQFLKRLERLGIEAICMMAPFMHDADERAVLHRSFNKLAFVLALSEPKAFGRPLHSG